MNDVLADAQALALVVACAGLVIGVIAVPFRVGAAATVALAVVFAWWSSTTTAAVVSTWTLLIVFLAGTLVRDRRNQALQASRLAEEEAAALIARSEAAVLEERGRLAREMHDVLGHSMAALMIQVERARVLATRSAASDPDVATGNGNGNRIGNRIGNGNGRGNGDGPAGAHGRGGGQGHGHAANDELVAQLEAIHATASRGLEEARQAIGALRGELAVGVDGLRVLVGDFAESTGIHCSIDVDGDPSTDTSLPPELDLTIYRLVQEALTNAVRHGPAQSVHVEIAYGDEVRVSVDTVQDAVAGHAPNPRGWGLTGVQERVALSHGTFTAGPSETGFRVAATLPASGQAHSPGVTHSHSHSDADAAVAGNGGATSR
jgi:signal transduction histidine kinase